MKTNNDFRFRLGLLAMLLTLVGCANMEPGMRVSGSTAGRAPTGKVQQRPIIKLITPAVIADEKAARAQSSRQDLQGLVTVIKPYLIGNGDLLSILVWNHPELNIAAAGAQALSSSSTQNLTLNGAQSPSAYVVDQDGQVQFPYVGAIKLAGLTELQARDRLAAKLVESIKRPDITLRVLQYRSKRVFVDGEVKTPGNQAIDDVPMTLLEALSRAGGLLPTSDQSAIVISRAGISTVVNLPALVRQGVNPSNVVLLEGDVVRVPSRDENKVYVLGEVNKPVALPMINGRLTLTQALGEAGGLNPLSAAGKQVYVVRNASAEEPLVFNLDAKSPVAMALADNFELSPRDVVYVDVAGLARFNRILTLIIPNATGATTSYFNVSDRSR